MMPRKTERRKLQDTIDDMRETLKKVAGYCPWSDTTAEGQAKMAQDCLDRNEPPKSEIGSEW